MIGSVCIRRRWSFVPVLFAFVGVLAGACSETPTQPTGTVDKIDLVVGSGTEATNGRVAAVHYTGWLADDTKPDRKGTQFDSSVGGQPFSFRVGGGQVIKGWDQGVAGMRIGGTRRLIIPATLAYGASGSGTTIPPNATLVFDIELLGVQ